jgi:hypothetical protein
VADGLDVEIGELFRQAHLPRPRRGRPPKRSS